jgi:hypothetical protein
MFNHIKTAAIYAVALPYAVVTGTVDTVVGLAKRGQRATDNEPRPPVRFEDLPLDEQLYCIAEDQAEWDGEADMTDELHASYHE